MSHHVGSAPLRHADLNVEPNMRNSDPGMEIKLLHDETIESVEPITTKGV